MGKRPFYRKVRQTLHETVSDSGKSILCYRGNNDKIYYVASSNDPNVKPGGGMIEVTWQELKNKRDAGELIPGCLYRITDYQCTTTQENTKSAGHQFDIVLLALSENKLAEEGRAMEHPTDVYDVTFSDGVTKKCYWYYADRYYDDGDDVWYEKYHIVDVNTKLGTVIEDVVLSTDRYIEINEDEKTINMLRAPSHYLATPDLTYNYFQNSNLSAWKVWYCLDNNKSRFAWADDSVDEGTLAFITTIDRKGNMRKLYRDSTDDLNNLFAWNGEGVLFPSYSASQTPSTGDTLYSRDGNVIGTVNSFTPGYEGTGLPNGRGVIYRLIDEWGNDVPYDFKNIQYVQNEDIFYAFSDEADFSDYSLNGNVKDNRCFLNGEPGLFMPYYMNASEQHAMCISNIFLGASVKDIVHGDTFCNIYKDGNLVTQ